MPRSKTKPAVAAASVFHAPAHPLPDDTKARLIELLGYPELPTNEGEPRPDAPQGEPPPQLKALAEVARALGLYIHGVPHMDRIPRPADHRITFGRAQRAALKLLSIMNGWQDYSRGLFEQKGGDFVATVMTLGNLAGVAAAVVKDFEGKSSVGARPQNALTETVRRLLIVFREHYQGPRDTRQQQGAIQALTDREEREAQFVDTALRANPKYRPRAEIDRPLSNLRKLFSDPRCSLPGNRPDTVERLARKAQRARAGADATPSQQNPRVRALLQKSAPRTRKKRNTE